MPTKKYISKIVKGGNDIYIKDAETRENVQYEDVYIGVAAQSSTIIDPTYHHDMIYRGRPISIGNSSGYLWVIMPSSYTPSVLMSGFEVPMSQNSTTTVGNVTYKIWKSSNSYSGGFNIYLT